MSAQLNDATRFRRGDRVRIRTREEILATLDPAAEVDNLPFMPEMLAFCGQELTVSARADKTCNTIDLTGTTLKMIDTVHLTGARCDGSAHGGCQAGCLLFWKEEWLAPADLEPAATGPAAPDPARKVIPATRLEEVTTAGTIGGRPAYRCQATQLKLAATPLNGADPRQYVRDVKHRNVGVVALITGLAIEIFNLVQRRVVARLPRRLRFRDGLAYPFYRGTGPSGPVEPLGLQPGDTVRIKSQAEIEATLGPDNRSRGMWFDSEMLPFCGREAKVLRRVDTIINEKTGVLMKLKDCVILEDVVCLGIYHRFCQRATFPFWREAWLTRVTPAVPGRAPVPATSAAE